MGIPCTEPAYIYEYNQSVLANMTMPHSVLNKKSNSIEFPFFREGSAKDEWRTTYVNTNENPAILWRSPSLQGRSVRTLLLCFCTISKIRWFVSVVEVQLHLKHSVFFIFNIVVDVGLVLNHELSEIVIGFMYSYQWVFECFPWQRVSLLG